MIDVDDKNKAYYYHFDGLGSVVALSNSNGDSCQGYEYSAYGQVLTEPAAACKPENRRRKTEASPQDAFRQIPYCKGR